MDREQWAAAQYEMGNRTLPVDTAMTAMGRMFRAGVGLNNFSTEDMEPWQPKLSLKDLCE